MKNKLVKTAKCNNCNNIMVDVPNGQMHCSVKCKFDSIGYTVNENGCHIWNGTKSKQKSKGGKDFPYGVINYGSKHYAVHVFACESAHGEKPSSKHHALHSCDNPSCCNPDHLRWGTAQENSSVPILCPGSTLRDALSSRERPAMRRVRSVMVSRLTGASISRKKRNRSVKILRQTYQER